MPLTWPENFSALWKAMSASRTIPYRSPTITPHIETVCANNTRICPTNSDKRASSPLYPGSMASNSISVSVNLNAAPDTAESNYLPLQNLCRGSMAIAITYRSNRNKVIPRIECPGFIELFHQADGLPMNNFGLYPDLYTRRFVATGRLRPSLSQNRKCWISFNQTLTNWGMQTSNSGSMSIVRFNQRIGNAVALVRYSSVRVA